MPIRRSRSSTLGTSPSSDGLTSGIRTWVKLSRYLPGTTLLFKHDIALAIFEKTDDPFASLMARHDKKARWSRPDFLVLGQREPDYLCA
jgi:hypothetical protein